MKRFLLVGSLACMLGLSLTAVFGDQIIWMPNQICSSTINCPTRHHTFGEASWDCVSSTTLGVCAGPDLNDCPTNAYKRLCIYTPANIVGSYIPTCYADQINSCN